MADLGALYWMKAWRKETSHKGGDLRSALGLLLPPYFSIIMKAYLDPEEIKRLEEAATNMRDKLLIRLLFRLGCRISEALAISVEDIDFKQGTISIIHLKRRVRIVCNNCGARLGQSHSFCPNCGEKIKK